MIDTTEVLVVGAGPAGSTLAGLLADRGIECRLVDRAFFPRVKPCGETINPGAVRLLRTLGLLDTVTPGQAAPLRGWRLTFADRRHAIGYYTRDGLGLGYPRRELDAGLLRAAERRGAVVSQGVLVSRMTPSTRGGFIVEGRTETHQSLRLHARILVGADGLRSVVSRRLGLAGHAAGPGKLSITCRIRGLAPPRLGTLHVLSDYTVGMAPVHGAEPLWNVTVVMPSRSWRRTSGRVMRVFERCLASVTKDWPAQPEILDGPWTSGPFDRPVSSLITRDALLVGDAAGYFDPLTGQGVYQALRTAQLAADAIENTLRMRVPQQRVFAQYERSVLAEQVWTRRFQQTVEMILSRDKLRHMALALLATRGPYMDRLVQFAGDALPVRGLLRFDELLLPGGHA